MANEFVVKNALLTPYIGVSGSITAASAIARGMYVNSTLVASANNDVLVGLDINPTFTNGAFTGVSNYALRIFGTAITKATADSFLSHSYVNNADTYHNHISFFKSNGTTKTVTLGDNGSSVAYPFVTGMIANYGFVGNSNSGFHIYAGSNVNATFYTNGNVSIGTTTDGGYKLDVLGSARSYLASNAGSNPNFLVETTNGDSSVLQIKNNEGSFRLSTNNGTSDISNTTTAISMQTGVTGVRIASGSGGSGSDTAMLFVSGTKTSSNNFSRGIYINTTLQAIANNNTLIGLDISPTFDSGAFTGITNYALNVTGNGYFNSNVVTFAGTGGTTVGISTTANFLFDAVATAGNIAWYSQGILSMIMPGNNTGLNIFPSAANENNTTAEVRVTTRKRVNGNIYQAAAATNITGGATTGTFAATGTYGLDAINNLNGALVSGVRIAESFTAIASNQNAAYAGFTFVSTINQSTSVGLTAIMRGLYINPTLTSVVDFRAIETTIGKVVLSNTNHTATTLSVTNDNSSLATTTYGISSSATAPGASTVYGIYGTSIGGQTGYGGYFYANGNGPANRTYTGVYGVAGNYNTNTTATGGYFQVDGGGNAAGTYIGVVSNVVSSAVSPAVSRLFEGRLGGVAKFYVDTTGNGWFNGAVGIGSTTLNSTLVVNGSQSIGASYATTAAPSNGLIVQGNVGIGTSSPSSSLHVVGLVTLSSTLTNSLNITSSGFVTRITIDNTNASPNTGFNLSYSNVVKWALAAYGSNADFTFYNNATLTDSLFISGSTNNVGIRTNTPTARLDIPASVTSAASLRIRSGTAPTSPNDGDIWYDGTDFYGRVGATTKSFTAGGGGVTVSNYSPTVTAVTNVSSATIDHSSVYYISYNGEAYEVWGQVTMTPTAALTTTGFRITLPALSGGGIYPEVLSGSFTSSDGAVGRIYFGYPTDAAYFESVPPSTVSRTYSFRFIYKVIPL